jgi:hypothetical protein
VHIDLKHELKSLVNAVVNNLYISHLDSTDSYAISKFMDKYKQSLMKNEKYTIAEINRTVNNAKKLLQKDKAVISVGYNLGGKLVGYMAVDLKTGVCIFYYISYTGTEFSKIYKNLLQDLESVCKKKSLKTLIVPILAPQIYQEDIFMAELKNAYQSTNVEELIIKVLQNLGYEPLQGWSKFKQGVKELFVGGYQYDSAWSKNL